VLKAKIKINSNFKGEVRVCAEPTRFCILDLVRAGRTPLLLVIWTLNYLPLCAAEKNHNHAEL